MFWGNDRSPWYHELVLSRSHIITHCTGIKHKHIRVSFFLQDYFTLPCLNPSGEKPRARGSSGIKVGIHARVCFMVTLFKSKKNKLLNCFRHVDMKLRLTCWPFVTIGVDLNSQNQQKGAGVHRDAVLVHLKRVAGIISLTWKGSG